jgi:predicted Zn-dependent protease
MQRFKVSLAYAEGGGSSGQKISRFATSTTAQAHWSQCHSSHMHLHPGHLQLWPRSVPSSLQIKRQRNLLKQR